MNYAVNKGQTIFFCKCCFVNVNLKVTNFACRLVIMANFTTSTHKEFRRNIKGHDCMYCIC